MDDLDVTCETCRDRELDVLLATYGMIHCSGSDFCAVSRIYNDLDPVGGIRADPVMLRSWINRGYLELNAIGCVGVPKCLATYLEEHGYNITRAFKATLNRVKSETLEKYRRGLAKPVEEVEAKPHQRMVFAEKIHG
ncbi:MAG TPA: hypothetical protein PLQ35_03495 [bacterium]|nr:hypothetical protein [bacterium]HQL61337.1 hypothetical protein [bacterium]